MRQVLYCLLKKKRPFFYMAGLKILYLHSYNKKFFLKSEFLHSIVEPHFIGNAIIMTGKRRHKPFAVIIGKDFKNLKTDS